MKKNVSYILKCPDKKIKERIRYIITELTIKKKYRWNWMYVLELLESEAQYHGLKLKDRKD